MIWAKIEAKYFCGKILNFMLKKEGFFENRVEITVRDSLFAAIDCFGYQKLHKLRYFFEMVNFKFGKLLRSR